MEFVETIAFTRRLEKCLGDEDYRLLQQALSQNPEAGAIIRQTGGTRKIRWAPQGRGKSGGVRVIYYYNRGETTCYMLLVYAKNEQDSLSPQQKRLLKQVVQQELK